MVSEAPTVGDLEAASNFVSKLLPKADAFNQMCPLWHGWALRDAYLAGLEAGRDERRSEIVKVPSEIFDELDKGFDDLAESLNRKLPTDPGT